MKSKYDLGSQIPVMTNNRIAYGKIISIDLINDKIRYSFEVQKEFFHGVCLENYFEEDLNYENVEGLLRKLKQDFLKNAGN